MSRLAEAPQHNIVDRIPVKISPGGVLVAEREIPHGRNGHDSHLLNIATRRTRDGLHVPERPITGTYEIIEMTDFGGNSTRTDLANGEVELNLRSIARENGVDIGAVTQVPLEGFSTVNTGFATAQLALHKNHGEIDRVFYVNTNPRKDPDDPRSWVDDDNFGKFVYVELDNGAKIFTVNSKYALSFVKDHIKEAWVLKTQRNEQFLSRRQFIIPTMAVLSGDRSYIDKPLDVSTIKDAPEGDLIAQDGNGNLKTSWTMANLLDQEGIAKSPVLAVTIDGKTRFARNGLIDGEGETGDLVVQGGSSGYPDYELPTEERYAEVVVLFGDANKVYGVERVRDNTRVDITPAPGKEVHNTLRDA